MSPQPSPSLLDNPSYYHGPQRSSRAVQAPPAPLRLSPTAQQRPSQDLQQWSPLSLDNASLAGSTIASPASLSSTDGSSIGTPSASFGCFDINQCQRNNVGPTCTTLTWMQPDCKRTASPQLEPGMRHRKRRKCEDTDLERQETFNALAPSSQPSVFDMLYNYDVATHEACKSFDWSPPMDQWVPWPQY